MALITDPDQLNDGTVDNGSTEVFINTSTLTIKLNTTGNLSNEGVTGQALYSFLKEEWISDPQSKNLSKFTFPMLAITPEQFEWGNNGSKFSNWKPFNNTTRKLIRTAGWREYDSGGVSLMEWAGIVSLGTLGGSDQAYYQQVSSGSATDFAFAGPVNEPVQIYGNAANGNFDYRGYLKLFARIQGKAYSQAQLSDIGVTTLTYIVYRFPLTNSTDLKIAESDVNIAANPPYTSISIKYFASNQTRIIGSTPYTYKRIIQVGTYTLDDGSVTSGGTTMTTTGLTASAFNGGKLRIWNGANAGLYNVTSNNTTTVTINGATWAANQSSVQYTLYPLAALAGATLEKIYEKVQYQLRQTGDIDDGSGTVTGKTADLLLDFIGSTLRTRTDVFIDGIPSNDINRTELTDTTGTVRTFPFVAAGSLGFNPNITSDGAAKYWLYFKDANGNQIDTASAIVVNNNAGTPITGLVSAQSSISFDFDYDGNVQGGRTAGTNAIVVLRVQGLTTAAWAESEFTITRNTGLSFSVVSPLERNYRNT